MFCSSYQVIDNDCSNCKHRIVLNDLDINQNTNHGKDYIERGEAHKIPNHIDKG